MDIISKKFEDEWMQITTYGILNHGIYIHKYNNILMKCTTIKNELLKLGISEPIYLLNKINQLNTPYKLLPTIHKLYRHQTDNNKFYIIMDKLHGNLAELLYEYIPHKIIDTMHIKEIYKIELHKLFNILSAHHAQNRVLIGDICNIEELIKIKYNYPEITIEQLKEKIKLIINDDDTIDYLLEIINDKYPLLIKLKYELASFTVSKDIYDKFISIYKSKLIQIMPVITNQVIKIMIDLYQKNIIMYDLQLFNFGYILDDNNDEHLGLIWEDNRICTKYLKIFALDYGGLLDITSHPTMQMKIFEKKILHNFNNYLSNIIECPINSTFYTFNQIKLSESAFKLTENFINISSEIFNIITTDYTMGDLSMQIIEKRNYASYSDIINYGLNKEIQNNFVKSKLYELCIKYNKDISYLSNKFKQCKKELSIYKNNVKSM